MRADRRKKIEYLRLSCEDGDVERGSVEESCSIASQRICIQQFLRSRPDIGTDFEEIVDDGFSGTNMRRPGMRRLLALAERGEVGTIIVRDLSRFARNYLEAGHYLEFVFPVLDIRFISINDHFDSAEVDGGAGGMELAIRNLINQMYSRDISRKIKSVVDMKKRRGEYAFGAVPYGYLKGEEHNTIVVDGEAAPVVKQIFAWAAEGVSITQIARLLNEKNIKTPSAHLANIRGKYHVRQFWTYDSVRNLLQNRIYTGDTEPFKSHVCTVGSNRVKLIPEELREVIPNTHEPIITREQYYLAKRAVKTTSKKSPKAQASSPLQSYLVCGCCGNRLSKGKSENKFWMCASARYTDATGCGNIRVGDSRLQAVLLRAIQNQCRLADAYIQESRKRSHSLKSEEAALRLEIKSNKSIINAAKEEKMRAYERYVDGNMTKEDFLECKRSASEKMEQAKFQLNLLEERYEKIQGNSHEQERDTSEVKGLSRYREVTKLTPELMRELVKSVTVYSESAVQIEWNFNDGVLLEFSHENESA